MPDNGVEWLKQEEILSYEEITEIVREGVKLGIQRVRITGGEPLVRKGITTLVKMLSEIKGIREVTMTTNGILLSDYANDLVSAGLKRINISLDTLDSQKYRDLTRGGNLDDVLEGIMAIRKAGLQEIKLNCVIMNSSEEPDARSVKAFALAEGLKVQFIHQMNLETGQFSLVEGGNGGNCKSCNRLRLTSNGYLKPCLFNSSGFNVREFGIREAFRLAVENKPKSGTRNQSGHFYNIGG
jgi:cyclic pyranopterin phosphate synthase